MRLNKFLIKKKEKNKDSLSGGELICKAYRGWKVPVVPTGAITKLVLQMRPRHEFDSPYPK